VCVSSESHTDLDSHADQCAVGDNSLIVHDYERPINVSGYDPTGPIVQDLKTVSAALAYDDPVSGETVILIVHQAIHIPDLSHNLLSTMQVRLNDVTVNETPRFLTEKVSDYTHSLVIPTDDYDLSYVIPLSIRGVSSSFPTRKPTVEEYETLPHLCLTSDDPPYDPHDPTYEQQEHALTKFVLETGDRLGAPRPSRRLCTVSKTFSSAHFIGTGCDAATESIRQLSPTYDDALFRIALSSRVGIGSIRKIGDGKRFDSDLLARNWGIDRSTAKRTIDITTQRGVRTVLHPTLSRRFRTNDRQLRYRRLPIDCFTDTLISNLASRRNNKYAQIFATADGWCSQGLSNGQEVASARGFVIAVPTRRCT
jgi:hypothetical protein